MAGLGFGSCGGFDSLGPKIRFDLPSVDPFDCGYTRANFFDFRGQFSMLLLRFIPSLLGKEFTRARPDAAQGRRNLVLLPLRHGIEAAEKPEGRAQQPRQAKLGTAVVHSASIWDHVLCNT